MWHALPAFLASVVAATRAAKRVSPRSRVHSTARYCPTIELLEARWMPAPIAWLGGGDKKSWSDPKNWSRDRVPQRDDDVTIYKPTEQITLDVAAEVGSLTLAGGRLTVRESLEVFNGDIDILNPVGPTFRGTKRMSFPRKMQAFQLHTFSAS